jgi:hypothetical protein
LVPATYRTRQVRPKKNIFIEKSVSKKKRRRAICGEKKKRMISGS